MNEKFIFFSKYSLIIWKAINWELWKGLTFGHAGNWYMHKPESVVENGTYKILQELEIQTDPQIAARRLDLVLPPPIKKKKNKNRAKNKQTKIPKRIPTKNKQTENKQAKNQKRKKKRTYHVWIFSCRCVSGWKSM